ncbi:MAG: hypothetical protein SNI45_07195 [Rikenellaceae bacterium]
MKRRITLFLALLMASAFTSCSTRIYSISSGYQPVLNNSVETNKTKGEVITQVLAFLTENGSSIGLVDRESGIITTNEESFLGKDTQIKNGTLIDADAYVVSGVPPKSLGNTNMMGDRIDPYEISGYWSVRISEEGSITKVNIIASNLKCKYRKVVLGMASSTYVDVSVESTGVFENKLINYIK